jgi:hypothetical protein
MHVFLILYKKWTSCHTECIHVAAPLCGSKNVSAEELIE